MEPWKFEVDTFASVTRHSYKLTDIILKDHVARALKATTMDTLDPILAAIFSTASAELVLWSPKYAEWRMARAVYKSRTMSFMDLLDSLSVRIENWDIEIQAAGGSTKPYKAGKPAYLLFFPQGRKPFTNGARDARVNAVETLADTLEAEGLPLATVAAEVRALHDALVLARSEQSQAEGHVDLLASQLEACRLSACIAMFRNVGRAMTKYGPSDEVGKFFDLAYIRDGAVAPPDDAPDAPGDFTVAAVPGEAEEVATAWGEVAEATSYDLYRRLPGESAWTHIGTTTGLTLMVGSQPTGVALEFAVTATNAAGEGPRSVPESITL